MSKQYLDENGLAYLWEKVKNLASGKVDKENGKVLSSNDYTSTEKTKLAGIASGAQVNVIEGIQIGGDAVTLTNKIGNIPVMGAASSSAVGTKGVVPAPASGDQGKFLRGDATWQSISEGDPNQNAFSNVKVGSTTIAADTTTDTLELVAGSNITLTPDATNDKLTIDATDTTYSEATTSAAGLMSSDDKSKLDGIASGATVDDHKWGNVGLTKTESGADTTSNAYIPYLSSTSGTGASLLRATSTPASGKSYIAKYNSGYLKSLTPASTDNSTTVATTAFVKGLIGAASGVASLDANGLVPSEQLPSYVDDIIEAYARSGQTELSATWLATGSATGDVITPETGKIYILMADSGDYSANDQFRWGGTTYVKLSDGGVSAITNAEIDTICV